MTETFIAPSGLRVGREIIELPYDQGIDNLIDRLDREPGAYLSSGVEDPDKYSRLDMGFASPPLSFEGTMDTLTVTALTEVGVPLLKLLTPILVAGPETTVESQDERVLKLRIARTDAVFPEEERSRQPSVLSPIRRLLAEFEGYPDLFLGLYGAFGYDLIFTFEPMPLTQARDPDRPILKLFLADRVYVLDRHKETATCHQFTFQLGGLTTEGVMATRPEAPFGAEAPVEEGGIVSDLTDEQYQANVVKAKEHMRVGDVFEVVLSRTFSAPFRGAPSALFRTMRRINPSPYEFLFQLGDEQLVGASPEMFVRVDGDRVESAPISGTVRRGANPMEDADRLKSLFNSEKDEVELTMCTDVDRNDKARICRPGTVKLLARRNIERYAGLIHTVDHVEGRLRAGFTGIDGFLSHMWAVTLTGAPKRMAVRLVEDMEATARQWYGGAVGVLSLNGNVNTGITIRTVHLRDGRAYYRAGSTLVFDSVPEEEEQETRTKATSFFRAMEGGATRAIEPEAEQPFAGVRVVMVDNEDSFVHTLADYFRQTGAEVTTFRAGTDVDRLLRDRPALVVHSPGPGRPADFGAPELIRELTGRGVPQFGVCLGLQAMVEAFGGELGILPEPRHGKRWTLAHDGTGLFEGLPNPAQVGAYHSLYAVEAKVPDELQVTARNERQLVMAVRHRTAPLAAVQFHPESILSLDQRAGHRLVENALRELASPAD